MKEVLKNCCETLFSKQYSVYGYINIIISVLLLLLLLLLSSHIAGCQYLNSAICIQLLLE